MIRPLTLLSLFRTKINLPMVYVTNGQINPGHRPQTTDEYVREPTRFAHNEILDVGIDSDLHLYVCAACPWAHRALLVRNLSDTLKRKVEVSVVSPFRDDVVGWEFKDLGENSVLTLTKTTGTNSL